MSTPTPDDAGAIAKILAGLGTAVAVVGGWLLKHTHDKIDSKVDKDTFAARGIANTEKFVSLNREIEMQRGHVAKIFDDIAEFKKDTNHQFGCLTSQIDEKYISLLQAIHGIDKK